MHFTPQEPASGTNEPSTNAETTITSPKRALWALVAIVVVAAAAGSAWAYMHFSKPSKDEIFNAVFKKFENATSYEFAGAAHFEAKLQDKLAFLSDETLPAKPANAEQKTFIDFDFTGITRTDRKEMSLTLKTKIYASGDEDNKLAVGFDVRRVDGLLYARLNQLPTFGVIGLLAGSFKDQWVSIDLGEIEDLQKSLSSNTSTTDLDAEAEKLKKFGEQLDEQFINVLKQSTFTELASEKIDGSPTYHYRFEINKPALETFLDNALAAEATPESFKSELKEFREKLRGITFSPGEIWVDTNDLSLRKITFNGVVDIKEGERSDKASYALTGMFKNYNNAPAVEKPASSKTIMELLGGSMFGGQAMESDSKAGGLLGGDLYVDTDGDGLLDQDEAFYKADPKKKDTDGDGYNDGDEVKNGYSPIGPGKLTF